LVALELGRKAFLSDLNPFAVFVGDRTARLSEVEIRKLGEAYLDISKKISKSVEFVRTSSEEDIENYKIEEWFPTNIQMPSNSDFKTFDELFDKKQLIVLSKLYKLISEIEDEKSRETMRLVFSTTVGRSNLSYTVNENRGLKGGDNSFYKFYRFWKPKKIYIIDVWEAFESRFKSIKRAIEKVQKLSFNLESFQIHHTSATDLKYLENQSIDYIYTDPPYGKKIAYLDLSTVFNAWLKEDISDLREKEAIEGGNEKLSEKHYVNVMFDSFREMSRVLKDGKFLTVVFQDKNLKYWSMIIDDAQKNGFKLVNTVVQSASTITFHKKKNPLSVMGSQLILNFQKEKSFKPKNIDFAEASEIESLILSCAEDTIVKAQGLATLDEIYVCVVTELSNSGLLHIASKHENYKDLTPLLDSKFKLNSEGTYTLRPKAKSFNLGIPKDERIKLFLVSLLRRNGKADFDELVSSVLTNITDEVSVSNAEISEVLEQICIPDGNFWRLSNQDSLFDVSDFVQIPKKKTLKDVKNGHEFEEYVKDVFVKLGFEAGVTKKSGDFGADIVMEKNGKKTVVQTKLYSKPVSLKAVQEIVSAIPFYEAHNGIVVTNSTFTKSAKELAEKNHVKLYDGKDLELITI
jgi:hypothetical protein